MHFVKTGLGKLSSGVFGIIAEKFCVLFLLRRLKITFGDPLAFYAKQTDNTSDPGSVLRDPLRKLVVGSLSKPYNGVHRRSRGERGFAAAPLSRADLPSGVNEVAIVLGSIN